MQHVLRVAVASDCFSVLPIADCLSACLQQLLF